MDVDSGRRVRYLSGDLPSLGRLVFSPDGKKLAASSASGVSDGRGRVLIWDLVPGAAPEPVAIESGPVNTLAFSADGRRLATTARAAVSMSESDIRLWNTTSGRDLATWSIACGIAKEIAFDSKGDQLCVASYDYLQGEGSVTRFDASRLAPEVEAVDLVNRLGTDIRLNAELAARIAAEPGLDPAVRAAALTMARDRAESAAALRYQASQWLDLAAHERTPELIRRAPAHAERAMQLTQEPDNLLLRVLAEARYQNGQFSAALEPLYKAIARPDDTTESDPGRTAKIQR